MKKLLAGLATGLFMICMAGMANATLINTGTVNYDGADRKLVYDNDLGITWLDYTHGSQNWGNQMVWAEGLSFTINNVAYDDWRLPSAGVSPQSGYNKASSEMGHLFYAESGLNDHFDNLISNSKFTSWYWTGTVYAVRQDYAWKFNMNDGNQHYSPQSYYDSSYDHYGLAVFNGRVSAASPVPEPATMLLMGTGLAGLVGSRLRRKKKA